MTRIINPGYGSVPMSGDGWTNTYETVLRRAVKVLRDHAASAAEDPSTVDWSVSSSGLHMDGSADYTLRARRGLPPALWQGRAMGGVPEYVELMHPPVALALADVLEREADAYETEAGTPECPNCGEGCGGHEPRDYHVICDEEVPCACIAAHLTLARAITREESK